MPGHLAFLVAGLLTAQAKTPTRTVLFETNRGQSAPGVAFVARTPETTMSIGTNGAVELGLRTQPGVSQPYIAIVPEGAGSPRVEPLDRNRRCGTF
jgi:hypothetical protein